MSSSSVASFAELLGACTRSAVHLELRDTYAPTPRFEAWKRGERIDWDDRAPWWHPYDQLIADTVARGVVIRRARIVSEPVSEYIRWEHYVTHANVTAGEQVRWLPRHRATGPQLFAVVEGSGWVSGGGGGKVRVKAGQAAYWESGEEHESGTDRGMTAIVVECPTFDPGALMREVRT